MVVYWQAIVRNSESYEDSGKVETNVTTAVVSYNTKSSDE